MACSCGKKKPTGPAALPPAPTLLSPENGRYGVATSVTLSWNASSGATGYCVQVSADPAFTNCIFNQSGISQTSRVIDSLNDTMRYYWRVQAANGNGSSGWSAVWCFTTVNVGISKIGSYNTPGWAVDVVVEGNYAYVADNDGGLRILDISNPATPFEAGYYDTPRHMQKIVLSGKYVYMNENENGMRIIDISNPSNPVEAGFYDIYSAWYEGIGQIAVAGNYAYITDSFHCLRIIDVTNPSNLIVVGTLSVAYRPYAISVKGSYAYIAEWADPGWGEALLHVIDVSNPTVIIEVGKIKNTNPMAVNLVIDGNYAYISDVRHGLAIANISNPVNPYEVGRFPTSSYIYAVDINGHYAYVSDTTGILIIDISNPTEPIEIGHCNTPSLIQDLYVHNNYIYDANGGEGLLIYKVDYSKVVKTGQAAKTRAQK